VSVAGWCLFFTRFFTDSYREYTWIDLYFTRFFTDSYREHTWIDLYFLNPNSHTCILLAWSLLEPYFHWL